MGLSERGEQILGSPVEVIERGERLWPDGRSESFERTLLRRPGRSFDSGQRIEGMFGEQYPLATYELVDGRTLTEYVQETYWSAGPCIFLALCEGAEEEPLAESLWTEKEMLAAI